MKKTRSALDEKSQFHPKQFGTQCYSIKK